MTKYYVTFNAFREVHFAIAHKMRVPFISVAEPDKQEQRNTDIGRRDTAPVDGIFRERFIVLPQRNNQAQYRRKSAGRRPGTVRQIIHIMPLVSRNRDGSDNG